MRTVNESQNSLINDAEERYFKYKEIFIIQEGVATFTVGCATLEAHAGQIIIVPADVPHKFMNLSDRQLKQIDIHVNKEFITEWLED